MFTDPDNPDENLPELATLLAAAPKRSGPWMESETLAKQRAAREGKPLLIWFTDGQFDIDFQGTPKQLNWSTPPFEVVSSFSGPT